MNTAAWIPDEFMRRVKNEEDWYFFDPREMVYEDGKTLHECFGKQFDDRYEDACRAAEGGLIKNFRKIPAKELWKKTQKINIQAPLILIQEFSKQKQAETIVNISSLESLIPSKNHQYYSISKSALNMLTKSAAQEYGHLGIRINSISPGLLFRNNIQKDWPSGVKNWQDKSPMKKLVNPKDVANTAIFLASDFSHSINGENIIVDTGMSCVQAW